MSEGIVITGMGIVSPIGCNGAAFWESLRTGRSGTAAVEGLDVGQLPRKIACQVREPPELWIPEPPLPEPRAETRAIPTFAHKETLPLGRASKLAMAASQQAITSARLDRQALRRHRLGITVGTTMGETEFIEERLSVPDGEWLSPEHVQQILTGRPGCIAENVADALFGETGDDALEGRRDDGTTGARDKESACSSTSSNRQSERGRAHATASPSRTAVDLYGACAAGNMALAAARRQLLDGRCDIALAGGADGFSRLAFIGFMRLRVMAAEICRPFDQKRDGLLVGEGAAMFVLERASSAKARGAPILARISGSAITCENYHPTRPHPEGDGLSRATLAALRDAGLAPEQIDYVCAHGTGTPQNDAIEVKVMERCFPPGVPFSSIKALTGHTMGAAAAMEAACCVLCLRHQTLIPTWHLDNVLQPCALDAVRGGARPAPLRHVLNNSAGFGGYNASLILSAP